MRLADRTYQLLNRDLQNVVIMIARP